MGLTFTMRVILALASASIGLTTVAVGVWPGLMQGQPGRNLSKGSALRPHAKHCNPYVPKHPIIDDVLKGADRIVLANVRAVRPNPQRLWDADNVIYELRVRSVVKGAETPGVFELAGVRPKFDFAFDPSLLDVTYRHATYFATAVTTADAKLERRRFYPADRPGYCEYAPYFEIGIDYLVIVPEPYTAISFEPVLNLEDAWLNRVTKSYGTHHGLY